MVVTQARFSSWEELEKAIRECSKCPLHKNRKNAVPGEGPRDAKVMLIGEAPGATEDELGRPFVGAAGRLLTMTLESVGLPRSKVYITNVVKCRPPGNREPREEEIEACSPYLESQVMLLKPRVIVTLGNVAGKWVFSKAGLRWGGVTKMRGRVYEVKLLGLELYVIPTIHPAAALYNPSMRNMLMEDLRKVKEVVEGSDVSSLNTSGSRRSAKSLLDYLKGKQR